MDERNKRLKEASDGAIAQRLVEDPMLTEAYRDSVESIIAAWQLETNAERRESLWHELRGLKAIWVKLTQRVITGKMAAEQLEADNV